MTHAASHNNMTATNVFMLAVDYIYVISQYNPFKLFAYPEIVAIILHKYLTQKFFLAVYQIVNKSVTSYYALGFVAWDHKQLLGMQSLAEFS